MGIVSRVSAHGGPVVLRRARAIISRRRPAPTARTIVLGVTSGTSFLLLRGAPEHLRDRGWDVHVVASPGPRGDQLRGQPGITVHDLPMQRDPSPARDALALVRWVALLRRVRPEVVAVGTPKAGLLGSLAAMATGVPFRVYVLRGLRFETAEGVRRWVLTQIERLTARCAHVVQAVSYSLRDSAIAHGVAPPDKVRVVGAGSSNGVELAALPAEAETEAAEDQPLTIGFVGRASEDKGVDLLLAAIAELAARGISGTLLVVGWVEGDGVGDLLESFSAPGWRIDRRGHVDDVTPLYRSMTVLALPTRREGFPNVVLEAAVVGVPCVATAATGVRDAIVPGVTGEIVVSRDPRLYADALAGIGCGPGRAARYGEAARARAERLFSRPVVHDQLERFYRGGRERVLDTSHTSPPS